MLGVAAVIGVGPPLVADRSARAGSVASPWAQPLLLSTGTSISVHGSREIGVRAGGTGVPEALPDGRIAYRQRAGLFGPFDVVPMPDGRLALTGYLRPGPHKGGAARMLLVLRPDGVIDTALDLTGVDNFGELVGATERELFLARRTGIVARDLATGAERIAVPIRSIPGLSHLAFIPVVDVAAGRIATAPGFSACTIAVFDVAGGSRVATLSTTATHCTNADRIRLSPDGRLVALTHVVVADSSPVSMRLAVFEVTTGAVRLDTELYPWDINAIVHKGLVGMAWSDASTLRIAILDLPTRPEQVYPLEEVVHVRRITVP